MAHVYVLDKQYTYMIRNSQYSSFKGPFIFAHNLHRESGRNSNGWRFPENNNSGNEIGIYSSPYSIRGKKKGEFFYTQLAISKGSHNTCIYIYVLYLVLPLDRSSVW